jgi:large subunit ribosomal protein L22
MMEVQSISKNVRVSPTKVRDMARRMRGMPVDKALQMTTVSERKAAYYLGKTLKSAIANAENNADLPVESLRVKEARVDEGARMKRFWPRARGMVSRIEKKMCHVKIVLTDEQ